MLTHQGLLPPRQWHGSEGILDYIRRVGCIQFDPVNVVARNPELVLQARIGGYRPELLDDLLYKSRLLIDGFDKVSSIHLAADWPAFKRYRQRLYRQFSNRWKELDAPFLEKMLDMVRQRGPVSSLEFEKTVHTIGYWGNRMNIERLALEQLLAQGDILIHHRNGNRRYYDITDRLLPADLLLAPDPFISLESYHDWHVLRRVGSAGIASPTATDFWLGILEMKSGQRWDSLSRLAAQGLVLPVSIEELPGRTFFIRKSDWDRFQSGPEAKPGEPEAIIFGPLDNLLWDRELLRQLFDFDYTWEVYKPKHLRAYGPYTLPVLLGDQFVARFDPKLDRATKTLFIKAWWWEAGQSFDDKTAAGLMKGFNQFAASLGAEKIRVDEQFGQDDPLRRLEEIAPE